jgi:hypothetical protein
MQLIKTIRKLRAKVEKNPYDLPVVEDLSGV